MSERQHLEQGIAALEAQRTVLGDTVVDAMLAAAREKIARLPATTPIQRPVALPPHLQGERKRVSVLIIDVKGSTRILEKIGTEAWVALMQQIFQVLQAEIYRFGGEVDQFRGDGLVAFFGVTQTHEDDPERSVLAALAMQSAIKPLAATFLERQGLTLHLRIGVNTGEVIVGSVGDQRRHSEDTATIKKLTKQSSQRELLSYKIFPAPKYSSPQIFDEFGQACRRGIDSFVATINGDKPPSEAYVKTLIGAGMKDDSPRTRLGRTGPMGAMIPPDRMAAPRERTATRTQSLEEEILEKAA